MKFVAKTRKVGKTLGIVIPNKIVKKLSLKEGDLVKITIKKVNKSYFGSPRSIGPFTEKDKFKSDFD